MRLTPSAPTHYTGTVPGLARAGGGQGGGGGQVLE